MSDDIAIRTLPLSESRLLAEVMPVLEQLPADPSVYSVLHDLARLCERSGFIESSLILYDRCLRCCPGDDELRATYADLTSACHAAAAIEPDPQKRNRHLHDGLYAATAALDPEGSQDARPTCIALAHRSVLLAEVGHYESALNDARRARALAVEHDMRRELVVAAIGEVVARWNATLDTTVLMLIGEINVLAEDLDLHDLTRPVTNIEVEVLWTLEHRDQARAVLQRHNEALHDRLHRRDDNRWDQICAGIDRLRQARDLGADPLTGLPTGRHLGRWLPEVLSEDVPVCIATVNIDSFTYLNQAFGRTASDGVLQELAALLERVCRRGDSVTRIGGDEFVMVLRDASPGDARVVLERIRQLIAARSWSTLPEDVHLSASVGATVGSGAANAEVLQTIARDALRHAKASGGDRISFR